MRSTLIKSSIGVLMVLLAITARPMTAEAATIDFDNLPGGGTLVSGTNLTNQYASIGVNFAAFEDGGAAVAAVLSEFAAVSENPPNNSGNAWFNCGLGCSGTRADLLRITFDSPVFGVQWYTDSEGVPPAPIRFEAYDAGGTLLETVLVGDTAFPNFVLTSFSVSGISRIDILQPSETWAWAIDNLSFEFAPVPEPATLLLLGTGLGAVAARRRLKKRA